MRQFIYRFLTIAMLLILAAAAGMVWYASHSLQFAGDALELDVAPGANMKQIAAQLVQQGVDTQPSLFAWLARLTGRAHRIQAGHYRLEKPLSAWLLLKKMSDGDVSMSQLTIIEGWTFRQLREALNRSPDLRHDSAALSEADILNRLGMSDTHPEGWFFPDTYRFGRGSSDFEVLRQSHRRMQRVLEEIWQKRSPGLPFDTPYEGLILASIVEKETGQATDRVKIASVFINRLRLGMLLQTDPTVIYGLGNKFDGNLRKRDLQADNHYNTYTRPGLPPTPIALPGLASLQASMNPQQTEYLYFVARGDGSSVFSRSLAEHNQAVRQFQKKR